MKQPSLYKLRGAVRITVTGGDIETLINTVAEQGLEVWNLRAHDGRVAEMNILLPHFFRLRPVLKRTGCRVKVTHRSGFLFCGPIIAEEVLSWGYAVFCGSFVCVVVHGMECGGQG